MQVNGRWVAGFIDSGNTLPINVISPFYAKHLDLLKYMTDFDNVHVGTAKAGASLKVLGVIKPKIKIKLLPNKGKSITMHEPLLVIKGLTNGLNVSGQFLRRYSLDQLHSKGCLKRSNNEFSLFSTPECKGFKEHLALRKVETHRKTLMPTINLLETTDEGIKMYSVDEPLELKPMQGTKVELISDKPLPETIEFCINRKFLPVKETSSNAHAAPIFSSYPDEQIIHAEKGVHYVYILNPSSEVIKIPGKTFLGLAYPVTKSTPVPIDISHAISNLAKAKAEKAKEMWQQNTPSSDLSLDQLDQRKKHLEEITKVKENLLLRKDPEARQRLINMLSYHWACLYRDGNPGGTTLIEHCVYTPRSAPPIRLKNRPINPALADDLAQQIATWLEEGVIKESDLSPWNFPLHPVKKKNGKLRWTVDFRCLNLITRHDSFPIPSILELLTHLKGSKFYTQIDLASAFHSIPVREHDQEKLAFSANDRFFRFIKLPFGLTSAPNTWARLITKVMKAFPKSQVITFFDDILIHSATLDEHMTVIGQVLKAINNAGLRINVEKSHWIQQQVLFLGHHITPQGSSIPRDFVKIITDWPLPKTLKELRSFLGKCNYYRKYIQNFGIIAADLMEHLKGGKESSHRLNLENDPKAVLSFNKLKEALASPSLLVYPDFKSNQPFIIDTDYSGEGIGAVISQVQNGEERPIMFAAKKLRDSQRHYGSYEGELLAVVYALEQFRFFLLGRPFIIRTDNSALTWLKTKTQKDKGMHLRWMRCLADFNFTVTHRSGLKHQNADSLSRAPHAPVMTPEEEEQLLMGQCKRISDEDAPDFNFRLVQAQQNDDTLKEVRRWIHEGQCPKGPDYKLLNFDLKQYANIFEFLKLDGIGMLIRTPDPYLEERNTRICVPASYQQRLIKSVHDVAHAGDEATLSALHHQYYFPRMYTHVRAFTAGCNRCQMNKKHSPQHHTFEADLVGFPGDKISIDFVGPLTRSKRGHMYILTILDCFSRWLIAYPCKDQTSKTVIEHLVRHYIPERGCPGVVHSDNGPAFISSVFLEAMRKFDIQVTHSPPYNPKSNPVERHHRTMKDRLKALLHEHGDDWDEHLPNVLLSMRTSRSQSTKFSPFYLEHGREARLPVDVIAPAPFREEKLSPYVRDLHLRLSRAFSKVIDQQKHYVDRHRELYSEFHKRLVVGDLVYLYTPRANPQLNRKFQSFWSGPYRIIERLSNVMFVIQSHGNWTTQEVRVTVAVDRLKRCTISNPDTNAGVPIALTAEDLIPYGDEGQELMGSENGGFHASLTSPHMFGGDEPDERPEGPNRRPLSDARPSVPPEILDRPSDLEASEVPEFVEPVDSLPTEEEPRFDFQPTVTQRQEPVQVPVMQPSVAPTPIREQSERELRAQRRQEARQRILSAPKPKLPRGRPAKGKGAPKPFELCPNPECKSESERCWDCCNACTSTRNCPRHKSRAD